MTDAARCEHHDRLGNQCPRPALVVVQVLVTGDALAVAWSALACDLHAFEATAAAGWIARTTQNAHVETIVTTAGEQLLSVLGNAAPNWPLAPIP